MLNAILSDLFKNANLEIMMGMFGQYYDKTELLAQRVKLNNLMSFFDENEDITDFKMLKKLDYIPSKTVFNLVKQCHYTQLQHMFDSMPDFIFTNLDGKSIDGNSHFFTRIKEENNFDKVLKSAFLDSTIVGKVGFRVSVSSKGKIIIRAYKPTEYTCTYDDEGNLIHVNFMYCSKETAEKKKEDQRWSIANQWIQDGVVYEDFKMLDGEGRLVPSMLNLELGILTIDFVPFFECENDGTLSEGGKSDLKDVMDPQNDYNKSKNAYTDAVRFNMCPITTVDGTFGVDEKGEWRKPSLAPNAIWQLTPYPGHTAASASVVDKKLDTESYKEEIDGLTDFIYNNYSIPRPEIVKDLQSGVQMDKAYQNLTKRCHSKSTDWKISLKKLVDFVIKIQLASNLEAYSDETITPDYNLKVIFHFRTFETTDEKALRLLPMVVNGVLSLETYLGEIGVEDVQLEISRIIAGQKIITPQPVALPLIIPNKALAK